MAAVKKIEAFSILAILLEHYCDALVTPKNSFASVVDVSEVLGSWLTPKNRTTDTTPQYTLHLFSTALAHLTNSARETYADRRTGKFIKF